MKQYNLHPNMYLLIPVAAVSPVGASEKFTSQHVSINSQIAIQISNCNQYLHPNMYLLIRKYAADTVTPLYGFTSQHVSINSSGMLFPEWDSSPFTSQHVSINSRSRSTPPSKQCHLHPNMYLLILCVTRTANILYEIYIPTCIY